MIVLFGLADEPVLAAVADALGRAAAEVLLLDQRQPPPELECGSGRLGHIDLAAVQAVYLRPVDLRTVARAQGWTDAGDELLRAARFASDFLAVCECSDRLVVNRLSAQASNLSKPWQLEHIKRWFAVPRTLVTTDPTAACSFVRSCPGAIVKSVSGVRSIVRRVSDSRLAEIRDVVNCPTLFQELVEGVDVRVHVVGDRTYATTIESDAADYRYDCNARREPCEVPMAVAARCVALSHSLGLAVSGIDLRRTPERSWVCFEVNPSPGFVYFEPAGSQPIADAIAGLLIDGISLSSASPTE